MQYSVEPLLRVAQAFAATPKVMAELGRLLRDPNTDLGEITAHLKRDPVVAARLLRLANSVAFAQSELVASIEDAAALIGYNEIHRLVGAVAVDQFSLSTYPLYGMTGRRLRENALFVALLMEELAGLAHDAPQAAYTAGLFRPMGKLALEQLAGERSAAGRFDPERDADLVIWEKHAFGITANEATSVILRHWHFPREIADAILDHYQPAGRTNHLTGLLNLAAGLADQLGYGLPGEQPYWRGTEEGYRACGIDPAESESHIESATKAFQRLSQAIS